ncbi:hypothetical protein Cfor_10603 [Coptotermes formosanus]|jgi:cytochrome P450 family 307 subfamily A|uniref:Cytochrome P450 n=1 Tax=Coptotermes formosanus TaxID=36987 RepID=A0A6L2Q447_COPFO|nr:hypothetical protein Cfor_10603 [Coptotermes formosanus]
MVVAATLALIGVVVVLVWLLVNATRGRHSGKQEGNKPPGPKPWPLIGSLHILGQYKSPFQGLAELAKAYGDIYSLTLGNTPCVVVNSFQLIKEVLISKGSQFGDRPNFIRFHKLFGGDRNNCKSRALNLRSLSTAPFTLYSFKTRHLFK